MNLFISWPLSIDAVFRPAYLAATGETVQDNPEVNATGDRYMVGSSRVTVQQCIDLQTNFSPSITWGSDPSAFDWIPAPVD